MPHEFKDLSLMASSVNPSASPIHYRPKAGGWTAVCVPGRLLALDNSDMDGQHGTWLKELRSEHGVNEALVKLIERRGGILALPSFVLVEWASAGKEALSCRAIVRGDEVNIVTVDSTQQEVTDARGIGTWVERGWGHLTGFRVSLATSSDSGSPVDSLSVVDGAVHFDQLWVGDVTVASGEQSLEQVSDQTRTLRSRTAPVDLAPVDNERGTSAYDHLFGETVFRSVAGSKRAAAKKPTGKVAASPLVLVLASGVRQEVVSPLVIGRAPSVEGALGNELTNLVVLRGANQSISRNHVRIALEGGAVVVTDLHSENGTRIEQPGKPAQRLRPGEPTPAVLGTRLDLGEGVVFSIEQQ